MAVSKRYPTDLHGKLLPPPVFSTLDEAVRGVVELQQDCWLTLVTDGELRRRDNAQPDLLAEARFLKEIAIWQVKLRVPRAADGAIAAPGLLPALLDAGVSYLQLDGTAYAPLIHKAGRAALAAEGRDADAELAGLLARDKAVLRDLPRDAGQKYALCFHDPHDFSSRPFAVDLDEAAARRMLHALPVNRFIFDCGGLSKDFAFLTLAPEDTDLGLGLIDNHAAGLPEPDDIVASIDEAAKLVDTARLALIPRFGFTQSPGEDSRTGWERQRQTLRLLMDSASRAWGIDF